MRHTKNISGISGSIFVRLVHLPLSELLLHPYSSSDLFVVLSLLFALSPLVGDTSKIDVILYLYIKKEGNITDFKHASYANYTSFMPVRFWLKLMNLFFET